MRIAEKYNSLGLDKKELFQYLVDNKKDLIKQKKSTPIYSEVVSTPKLFNIQLDEKSNQVKAFKQLNSEYEMGELEITVIANMANWMDSDDDVILRGAYNKSIQDKGNNIPFIKDHIHSVSAIIADTLEVKTQQINLESLGIESDINTSQALIFRGLVKECYDSKIYELYKAGQIKQHSIGLQYLNIELAVNDKDFKEEYKIWQRDYKKIINKNKADEKGYFFSVKEIKIFENSAVLFGSNEITPTLSVDEIDKSQDIKQVTAVNDDTVNDDKAEKSQESTLEQTKDDLSIYFNSLF